MPKKTAKKSTPAFQVEIDMNGDKFAGKGKTLGDAFMDIDKPLVKGKCDITLKTKGKKATRQFTAVQTRKILSSHRNAEILGSRLLHFLK